jgi:hypothetical protein
MMMISRDAQREVQDSLLESVMEERERGRKIRMKFLLKQSDVFRHFMPGRMDTHTHTHAITLTHYIYIYTDDFTNLTSPVRVKKKQSSTAKSPSRRLQEDEEEDEEEESVEEVLRYVCVYLYL